MNLKCPSSSFLSETIGNTVLYLISFVLIMSWFIGDFLRDFPSYIWMQDACNLLTLVTLATSMASKYYKTTTNSDRILLVIPVPNIFLLLLLNFGCQHILDTFKTRICRTATSHVYTNMLHVFSFVLDKKDNVIVQ